MACVMKTACCGKSLLHVAHVLLYFNLIVDVLVLWNTSTSSARSGASNYNPIDSYLLDFLTSDGYILAQLLHRIVEIFIFFGAIISIRNRKPSSPLLVVCVVFIMLEMFFCIYALIELNCKHSFEEFYRTKPESIMRFWGQILFGIQNDRFENKLYTTKKLDKAIRELRYIYLITLYILDFLFALILIFKAYSAMVIYSSVVELKQITSQHVHYNVERNAAQFIQPHTHLNSYPNSPPYLQYPAHPSVSGVRYN
ncbi:uncharacterized protein LOC135834609 [Planococcus citri]|uniref:uncharacterized protein LOC135834609 n=1 Tax=Planococcus citri TaxID=170843 RepID=UPI0031F825D5